MSYRRRVDRPTELPTMERALVSVVVLLVLIFSGAVESASATRIMHSSFIPGTNPLGVRSLYDDEYDTGEDKHSIEAPDFVLGEYDEDTAQIDEDLKLKINQLGLNGKGGGGGEKGGESNVAVGELEGAVKRVDELGNNLRVDSGSQHLGHNIIPEAPTFTQAKVPVGGEGILHEDTTHAPIFLERAGLVLSRQETLTIRLRVSPPKSMLSELACVRERVLDVKTKALATTNTTSNLAKTGLMRSSIETSLALIANILTSDFEVECRTNYLPIQRPDWGRRDDTSPSQQQQQQQPRRRSRRAATPSAKNGIFTFLGDLHKFLYGTATTEDVALLDKKANSIRKWANITTKVVDNIAEAVNNQANIMTGLKERMGELVTFTGLAFEKLNSVDSQNNLVNRLQNINDDISRLVRVTFELIEDYGRVKATGRVSSNLLPPTALLRELRAVASQKGLVPPDMLSEAFDITTVYAMSRARVMDPEHIFVDVPLVKREASGLALAERTSSSPGNSNNFFSLGSDGTHRDDVVTLGNLPQDDSILIVYNILPYFIVNGDTFLTGDFDFKKRPVLLVAKSGIALMEERELMHSCDSLVGRNFVCDPSVLPLQVVATDAEKGGWIGNLPESLRCLLSVVYSHSPTQSCKLVKSMEVTTGTHGFGDWRYTRAEGYHHIFLKGANTDEGRRTLNSIRAECPNNSGGMVVKYFSDSVVRDIASITHDDKAGRAFRISDMCTVSSDLFVLRGEKRHVTVQELNAAHHFDFTLFNNVIASAQPLIAIPAVFRESLDFGNDNITVDTRLLWEQRRAQDGMNAQPDDVLADTALFAHLPLLSLISSSTLMLIIVVVIVILIVRCLCK